MSPEERRRIEEVLDAYDRDAAYDEVSPTGDAYSKWQAARRVCENAIASLLRAPAGTVPVAPVAWLVEFQVTPGVYVDPDVRLKPPPRHALDNPQTYRVTPLGPIAAPVEDAAAPTGEP